MKKALVSFSVTKHFWVEVNADTEDEVFTTFLGLEGCSDEECIHRVLRRNRGGDITEVTREVTRQYVGKPEE